MDGVNYWGVFWVVFLCLCLKEGARVKPENNKPVSKALRGLWTLVSGLVHTYTGKHEKRD